MARLINKMEACISSGNDAEVKIAARLIKFDIDISDMSAKALGDICGVSNATIVRFAQSLGYKGYSALKFDYMSARQRHNGPFQSSNVGKDDSVGSIIKKSSFLLTESIDHSFNMLDVNMLEKASLVLSQAERVVILSQSSSFIVSTHISQKLMLLNKAVFLSSDDSMQLAYIRSLTARDVVLALSDDGDDEKIASGVGLAKELGGSVVSIVRSGESKMHHLSDITIPFSYSEQHLEILPSTVQMTQMALFDLLYYQIYKCRQAHSF